MIRKFNQKWEQDYLRKTRQTLQDQTDRRRIDHEKNAQTSDIDETMREGGGDEKEDGESEDDDEDGQGTVLAGKRTGTKRRKKSRFRRFTDNGANMVKG